MQRWTIIGLSLLDFANLSEQEDVEEKLSEFRNYVSKNYQDPNHECILTIESQKTKIIFYLFPEEFYDKHQEVMRHIASEIIIKKNANVKRYLIFARCINKWEIVFETVFYLQNECIK